MKADEFLACMTRLGYKVIGNSACGVQGCYPFLISYRTADLCNITFSVDTASWKSCRKQLAADTRGMTGITCANKGVTASLAIREPGFESALQALLEKLSQLFQLYGVKPLEICPICKQGGCDTLMYMDRLFMPVHNDCCEQYAQKTADDAEKNSLSGNYILGFIGGLLGAIAGAVPSVLSILLLQRIHALLFALIPMCVYYGYKKFKGKRNKVALGITIILTLAGVYFIQIMLLIITLITEYGIPFLDSVTFTFLSLGNGETWMLMTRDSPVSFLFAALGIWISWGYISRTSQAEVQSAKAQLSTRMPFVSAGTRYNLPYR